MSDASLLYPGVPKALSVLADQGPASDAVERALKRCLILSMHRKEYGITFPTVWRGVLLEMLKEARDA